MSYDKEKEKNSHMVWELAEFICFKHNVQSELSLVWLVPYWQSKTDKSLWRVSLPVASRNNMTLNSSDIKLYTCSQFYQQHDSVKGCTFLGSSDLTNKIKCHEEGK